MSIDKNLSKALDIEPIDVTNITSNTVIVASVPGPGTAVAKPVVYEDQEDFDEARDIMKDLLKKHVLKLDEMGSLASDLESARAFEVYSNMIVNSAKLAQDIYDLHQRKKDLRGDTPQAGVINVDKAVFYGNQTDVLQHLKKTNGNR